ncbi:MAG TPA: hypothetical protein VHV83_14355 [Armatimonadota bacterium]|nr:hypothetical protein [Armatimonadota bacterium]
MKRTPAQCWCLLSLFLLTLPSAVFANEVDGVAFPSTPFMFSDGFAWVPLLFLGLFIAVNTSLLRQHWGMTSRRAAWTATGVGVAIAVLAFTVIPLQYWWYSRHMCWGGHSLLGWHWTQLSPQFLRMNGITLALVICGSCCLAYYHPHCKSPGIPKILRYSVLIAVLYGIIANLSVVEYYSAFVPYGLLVLLPATAGVTAGRMLGKRSLALIGMNVGVYLLCLTPYLATGAFAHGYGPWQQCYQQLSSGIGSALIDYTRAHQGHLPAGRTMEQVFQELQPYYAKTILGMGLCGPIPHPLICKAGEWYDRHPRSYTWNADLAGKSIAELKTLPQTMLITCPYHKRYYISTSDMIKAYADPAESTFNLWEHN